MKRQKTTAPLGRALLALLAATSVADARLGETKEQIFRRLGPPVEFKDENRMARWDVGEEKQYRYLVFFNAKGASMTEYLLPEPRKHVSKEYAMEFIKAQISTFPQTFEVEKHESGASFTFAGEKVMLNSTSTAFVFPKEEILMVFDTGARSHVRVATAEAYGKRTGTEVTGSQPDKPPTAPKKPDF